MNRLKSLILALGLVSLAVIPALASDVVFRINSTTGYTISDSVGAPLAVGKLVEIMRIRGGVTSVVATGAIGDGGGGAGTYNMTIIGLFEPNDYAYMRVWEGIVSASYYGDTSGEKTLVGPGFDNNHMPLSFGTVKTDITSIVPSSPYRGNIIPGVKIGGTYFRLGAPANAITVSGSGVTANITNITVSEITATFTIMADAPAGARTINFIDGLVTAANSAIFNVTAATLTCIPASANRGTSNVQLTLTGYGSHFNNDGSTTILIMSGGVPDPKIATVNTTIDPAAQTISLTINIAADAAVGARTIQVTTAIPSLGNEVASAVFTVNIAGLQITTLQSDVPAHTGGLYNLPLNASGGDLNYKWAVSGDLPGGLKINTDTGIISGTPLESGSWNIKVWVHDGQNRFNDQDLTLTTSTAASGGLLIGPTAMPTRDGAQLIWMTPSSTTTDKVEYGMSAYDLSTGDILNSYGPMEQHIAPLSGLSPDSEYKAKATSKP